MLIWEHFRGEFEKVAFVFVSDDMDWGRKELENQFQDLFFVGSGLNTSGTIRFKRNI